MPKTFVIVLFSLIFLFGICHSETCNCISYIIGENGLSSENKIATLPIPLKGMPCDGNGLMICKRGCAQLLDQMSNFGKLQTIIPGKGNRVAEWMCKELKRDVSNARVGVFAETCDSDLMDTEFRFVDTLCCRDGSSC